MEPVSLTLAIVSLVASIALAVIHLFDKGFTCSDLRSSCCVFNFD